MTAANPPRIELAYFESALPANLRDPIRASAWFAAPTSGAQIAAALELVRDGRAPALAGWIAGMTMFVDHHRSVANLLVQLDRAELIPHALEALAAGVPSLAYSAKERPSGHSAPRKLWLAVEQLVLRSPRIPPSFHTALACGCYDDYPPSREAAIRLAVMLGAYDAIATARDAELEPSLGYSRTSSKRRLEKVALAIEQANKRRETGAEGLLRRLLAAWVTTRDPALEPAIALAGEWVARDRGPLVRIKEEAWLAIALADDPVDGDRLIDSPWLDDEPSTRARLDALARRAPHPRQISLARLAALHPAWSIEIHARIATLLGRIGARASLASLARQLDGDRARVYESAFAVPPPAAADPALLAEASATLAPFAECARLMAAHAANPSDLGLRAVLADALVLADDPQGEFIALQLAIADGTAGDQAPYRANDLLARNADRWVPPLPNVEDHARRFERGMVVALRTTASEPQLRMVLDRPEWTTLEELELMGGVPVELVQRAPLLRALGVRASLALDTLARTGTYPRLRVLATHEPWVPTARDSFPELRLVAGYYNQTGQPETALTAARALDLDAIVFYGVRASFLARLVAARRLGPPIMRVTTTAGFTLPWGWCIELGRDDDFARATLARYQRHNLTDITDVARALAGAGIRGLALFLEDGAVGFADSLNRLREAVPAIAIELGGEHVMPIDLPR